MTYNLISVGEKIYEIQFQARSPFTHCVAEIHAKVSLALYEDYGDSGSRVPLTTHLAPIVEWRLANETEGREIWRPLQCGVGSTAGEIERMVVAETLASMNASGTVNGDTDWQHRDTGCISQWHWKQPRRYADA